MANGRRGSLWLMGGGARYGQWEEGRVMVNERRGALWLMGGGACYG